MNNGRRLSNVKQNWRRLSMGKWMSADMKNCPRAPLLVIVQKRTLDTVHDTQGAHILKQGLHRCEQSRIP